MKAESTPIFRIVQPVQIASALGLFPATCTSDWMIKELRFSL
jgi:hypothetical protein